jgi:enoyl-CoA hydratase
MPAAAMLADRRSLLRQWSLPEEDAIRYEVEQGKAVFGLDFQAGAARFVAGEGRHGGALPGPGPTAGG